MFPGGKKKHETQLTALPAGWRAQESRSSGETYYVNEYTEESTYDVPTAPAQQLVAPDRPPSPQPIPATPAPGLKLSSPGSPQTRWGRAAPTAPPSAQLRLDDGHDETRAPVSLSAEEIHRLQLRDLQEAECKPLPDGWERVRSSVTGGLLYVNTHTHVVQAELPKEAAKPRRNAFACCSGKPAGARRGSREDEEAVRLAHQEAKLRPLPEGWERVRSAADGRTYFLNKVTQRRTPEFPIHAAKREPSGKAKKPTVKMLSEDVHHLKVQIDDLYRQLSTQDCIRKEQWALRYSRHDALRTKRRVMAAWSQFTARHIRGEVIVERMTGGHSRFSSKTWAFGKWVAMWRHTHRIENEERARELERVAHDVRDEVDELMRGGGRRGAPVMVVNEPVVRLRRSPARVVDWRRARTPSKEEVVTSRRQRAASPVSPQWTSSQLMQRRMAASRGGDFDDHEISSGSESGEWEQSGAAGGSQKQRDSPHILLQQMRSSPAVSRGSGGRRRRRL